MAIADKLNNKKILIWGYGREGKSTENFIKTHCEGVELSIFEGKREEINEEEYDFIIKSPGIYVENYGRNYISQTELFLEEFRDRTIGITGTKGKSTTSSLLYHVLSKVKGDNVFLVGNIGFPCLDYYDKIDENSIIVFEMSCHQLAHLKFSPHVAVFLNLYEDHLDYYKTLENYFSMKQNITTHQAENDFFFCGNNVPEFSTNADKTVIDFYDGPVFDMKLQGDHNQFNARFVYEICSKIYGLSDKEIRENILTFNGLMHRLQLVGKVNGIDFYNDSISTIPNATIRAIESVKNTKTVIIGGMDRHINYDVLIDYINEHQEYNYILSYESGKRIYEALPKYENVYYVEDLKATVELSKKITPEGKACVFSPAAASYGYFKNFEERGQCFTSLVLEGN